MSLQIKLISLLITIILISVSLFFNYKFSRDIEERDLKIKEVKEINEGLIKTIEKNSEEFLKYKSEVKIQIETILEQKETVEVIENNKQEEIKEVKKLDHKKFNDKELEIKINKQINDAFGDI